MLRNDDNGKRYQATMIKSVQHDVKIIFEFYKVVLSKCGVCGAITMERTLRMRVHINEMYFVSIVFLLNAHGLLLSFFLDSVSVIFQKHFNVGYTTLIEFVS